MFNNLFESKQRKSAKGACEWGQTYRFNRDYKAALSYFEKAVEYDPKFAPGWIDIGQVLERCGQREDAEKAFARAKSLGDKNTYTYYMNK